MYIYKTIKKINSMLKGKNENNNKNKRKGERKKKLYTIF